ncbi:MAG TPA: hypothetical protein VNA30_05380 [Mycobacteriales bacterium]|nr:hypothetical protein [Mycobacteriales bacterium]
MAVIGRVGRLTALALATGTLVAAGAGAAGAATDTRQLTADGKGAALELIINLPAAVAAPLGLGTEIRQAISLTDGSVSNIGGVTGVTTAVLGEGTTPVLSALLAKSTRAALGGKTEDRSEFPVAIDQPGLKISLLPLSSKVADPTTTTKGMLTQSSSGVARIAIGGLALPAAVDGLTKPVVQTLEQALGTGSAGSVGSVTGVVNGALGDLNEATRSTPLPAPVAAAVEQATETLTTQLNGLNTTLLNLNAATELLTLDSIISDQLITRDGAAMTSKVTNTIKNVNVLNGLVKVNAISSEASATAGGTAGSAKAAAVAPVLKVDVANGALTALIDDKGINLGGTVGSALPADLQGTVNGALTTVNGLLNSLAGVDVKISKGTTYAAPDGSEASADIAAAVLTVNPAPIAALLPAGKPFLQLRLVSAQAAVGSRLVPAPPQGVPAAAPGTDRSFTTSLPRTGAELPLTGVVATLLVGAALVARRRRADATV